jgi:hypothetical protein
MSFCGDVFELQAPVEKRDGQTSKVAVSKRPIFRLLEQNVKCTFRKLNIDGSYVFTIFRDDVGAAILGEIQAPCTSMELHRPSKSILWAADGGGSALYSLMFRTNYEFELFSTTLKALHTAFELKLLQGTIEGDFEAISAVRGTKRKLPTKHEPKGGARAARGRTCLDFFSPVFNPAEQESAREQNSSLIPRTPHNCHSCHYKRDAGVLCEDGVGNHSFCSRCLSTRFGVQFADIQNGLVLYRCPVCANACPCAKCSRARNDDEEEESYHAANQLSASYAVTPSDKCFLCTVDSNYSLKAHPLVATDGAGRPLLLCQPCNTLVLDRREKASSGGYLRVQGDRSEEVCAVCADAGSGIGGDAIDLSCCSSCQCSFCSACVSKVGRST